MSLGFEGIPREYTNGVKLIEDIILNNNYNVEESMYKDLNDKNIYSILGVTFDIKPANVQKYFDFKRYFGKRNTKKDIQLTYKLPIKQ